MNELGINKFLSLIQVGDELSVTWTNQGERSSYQGIVTEITKSSVWIRNNQNLNFFESLTTPALEEINFRNIWSYCITKNSGEVIAV